MSDDLERRILAEIAEYQRRIDALRLLLPENSMRSRSSSSAGSRKRAGRSQRGPHPKKGSIMEGVMNILNDKPRGMKAIDILAELRAGPFPDLERTSLSPQLSRLKQRGYLVYKEGNWVAEDAQMPLPYVVGEET